MEAGNAHKGSLLLCFPHIRFMKHKMILFHRQKSFLLHFTQFSGKGAAVYAEVVGQLLAVEGDGKVPALVSGSLEGQVGEQAPPYGFGGGVENTAGQV